LLCAVAILASSSCTVFAAAKPNVIVILTDDAGYSDYGFSAALNGVTPLGSTPNIDALASQSVVMRQGYASPLCTPTRIGLLTGIYQQRQGAERVLANDLTQTTGLSGAQTTVADRMKSLGYHTGMIGKWHIGYQQGVNRPNDAGFDEFFGFLSGNRQYFGEGAPSNQMYRNTTNVESQWRTQGDTALYETTGAARGRYVTDALGEEAAAFINNHANDAEPFFLYTAMSAPHDPYTYKQQDYDLFAGIANTTQRTNAAMVYALDRSVGMITNALTANGIDDNTIVIFLNDNGGAGVQDNRPWTGLKGTAFEGGIRVPYLIKAPGAAAGTYNSPVSLYDVAATAVAAGGGTFAPGESDGVNLLPYVSGANTAAPHEALYFRNQGNWAIRKGDWKLGRMSGGNIVLYNIASDPLEQTNLSASQAAKVSELTKDFTKWDAQMLKPQFGSFGALDRNLFDRFVFRSDLSATANWNTTNQWYQGGTTNAKTMIGEDAYANAILEFNPNDSANYTATNNMTRQTGLTFMLNRLEMVGSFGGAAARSATINGSALLFVKSLSGASPAIQAGATSSTASAFTYNLNNEIQLLDDLSIEGNGTQPFFIGGAIKDFDQPRGFTKTGTSVVTLAGANTFLGVASVNGGEIRLDGASAAINGAAAVNVGAAGKLTLAAGSIRTGQLAVAAGGQFSFTGGRLDTPSVVGSLAVNGGTFGGVAGGGQSSISGNFNLAVGSLEIELTKNASLQPLGDRIVVNGQTTLAGQLTVALANIGNGFYSPTIGDSFTILSSTGGIVGGFGNYLLPPLAANQGWEVMYTPLTAVLKVVTLTSADFNSDGFVNSGDLTILKSNFGTTTGALFNQGDANGDGAVDGDDLLVWQNRLGGSTSTVQTSQALAADFNLDGVVNQSDLVIVKSNFGLSSGAKFSQGDADGNGLVDGRDLMVWQMTLNGGALQFPLFQAVPEPTASWLAGAAAFSCTAAMRRAYLARRN
jgi:autotransporter-associated beta strand protein